MGLERGVKIMKRTYQNDGHVPRNLFELSVVGGSGDFSSFFTPSTTQVGQTIASKEWYAFLQQNGLLARHIKNNYWRKPLNDDLMGDYYSPFTLTDFALIVGEIANKACSVYWKNMYKYDKLWEALTVEFNPLWNVDGVEETVRTLERDGNIINAKSGNDETAKSGNDALVKSGTVTDAESGSTATAHTGTITTTDTGTDTTVYSGTETNTRNGARTNAKTGGKTTIESESTTDAIDFLNVKKTVESYTDGVNIPDGEIDTETYSNLTDSKAFNQRQDQVTKNLSNQQTNANTDTITHGKTDTTTFNNTDTQNYNSKDKTTYNSSNTETIDTLDTERTTHERHGNIGVTTTTQLLTEYVEYSKLVDFVDIVARDILETITMGVY